MCGIAGILNFGPLISRPELERFTRSLRHRGPDADGFHIDGDLGLGHTRLAILDLSDAGRCPMEVAIPGGKSLWITFNGEIFNFIELRAELKSLGYTFHSETDTEVIAAAYHAWGKNCLQKFNGMWAFAIWNPEDRSLFLARDRFGVKPLFFSVSNRFAFASEIKSFLFLDDFKPELHSDLVPLLLQNTAVEGTIADTIMKGVLRLLPGHCLTVSREGSVTIQKWWNTKEYLPSVPTRYEEQVEEFREIFLDAVRIRMRSDVPVGTCLSGGVDSTAVASCMRYLHDKGALGDRIAHNWQQTFVATFPGTMLDERKFADIAIAHCGAKPHYWIFDQKEAINHIIEALWSLDDIIGTVPTPVWCIYREMRKAGVVVSLDGHGSDELLAGYTWFLDTPMAQLNEQIYADFHENILPSILRNFDRCSAAHGIEVRMPFMDWRLVTYANALSIESKIGEGFTKRILRDAMKGIMPEQIRTRRAKLGFNSPMIEWFNGELEPLLRKVVNHPLWHSSPLYDGTVLKNFILDKCSKKAWTKDDWALSLQIWSLVSLVLWQLLYVEKKSREELTEFLQP